MRKHTSGIQIFLVKNPSWKSKKYMVQNRRYHASSNQLVNHFQKEICIFFVIFCNWISLILSFYANQHLCLAWPGQVQKQSDACARCFWIFTVSINLSVLKFVRFRGLCKPAYCAQWGSLRRGQNATCDVGHMTHDIFFSSSVSVCFCPFWYQCY